MINKLEVEISDDPVSGLKRKLIHDKLEIMSDLQMVHWRRIVKYEKLSDGSYGRPIIQAILENENLSKEFKQKLIDDNQPQLIGVSTAGVYVDAQGTPVIQNSDNSFPEGSIPELQFWQNLPISFLNPAPTLCSDVLYGLLKISMKAQSNLGKV